MKPSKNIIEYTEQSVMDVFRAQYETPIKLSVLVKDEKLVGVVSDGDIRRFILKGGSFDSPVTNVITKEPITASSWNEAAEIRKTHKNLTAIPIIDTERKVIGLYIDGKPVFKPVGIPVVINAGGKGTRLDPYTRILPKPLIPVGDVPVIELIMREFGKFECMDFSVIVNFKGQMIKAYFADGDPDYQITWVDEEKPLGTGGGLSLLRGRYDDTFFFTNCDTLIKTDYSGIVDQHKREKNKVTVVCACKNMRIPYGVIETEEGGRIKRIDEKPEMSFMTNVGMYVVEPEVIDMIGDDEAIDFTDIISRLLDKGVKVGVYPISEDEWLDMGQPDELERMRRVLEAEAGRNI